MVLNETLAMFNGQLLFDRPMHVKMVSMFKFALLLELVVVLQVLDGVWFHGWVGIQGVEMCDLPNS